MKVMRGRDLKSNVYAKLVSLNYSRKENYLYDANEIEWNELSGEIKNTILSFPARHIDWFVDLMDIEDLEGDQQFYLFHSSGKTFLVDTQGYNYPRYIIQLVDFEIEFGSEEFIDGVVRISDMLIFENVVKSLASELKREGFDKEDVAQYLQSKVKELV